jgi:ABC-2 type transport system ATP-binding protein
MLIDANHLRLSLHGLTILADVSLHLEPGEIYGLLGPNGAGKSTSIAVLLGLYAPEGGELRLFGESPADPLALRRRIGVMPERAGFYDWMNAQDYLVWYAGFYGGLQQPVADLLTLVGLGDSGAKPIGRFSRGMQQRLALARALVQAPELLILDEPTNGLDPRGRREIHDLLLQLAQERQVGVLLCTHLLDDVERLCNRVGVIDHGRTVAEARLGDLLGRGAGALQFRLRMTRVPDGQTLPNGVRVLNHEGAWWHLAVGAAAAPRLPEIWREFIALGWGLTEIHAEGGGLEADYLQLTSGSDQPSKEVTA